jgi:NAD(P)-dependent dehydrogenase (short-subunit alcohol dehydrogenase family)
MSKAGLEMITKSAALELARFGVRVNCVSSSFLNTNLYRQAGLTELENESVMQKEADTNPMGRAANIEEVCQVIVHLKQIDQTVANRPLLIYIPFSLIFSSTISLGLTVIGILQHWKL